MEILRDILVIAHFVGLAAILGPFLAQLGAEAKRVTMTMVWGARAQLLTGIALAGIMSTGDGDVDHMKLGVKLLFAIAVAGLAEVGRKRESKSTFWLLVGLFTFVNIVVAVVWR